MRDIEAAQYGVVDEVALHPSVERAELAVEAGLVDGPADVVGLGTHDVRALMAAVPRLILRFLGVEAAALVAVHLRRERAVERQRRLRHIGVEVEFELFAPMRRDRAAIAVRDALVLGTLVFLREGARHADILLFFLEARDADAERVEVIAELVGELVDELLIRRIGFLHMRAGVGDDLRHLVARDRLVALE